MKGGRGIGIEDDGKKKKMWMQTYTFQCLPVLPTDSCLCKEFRIRQSCSALSIYCVPRRDLRCLHVRSVIDRPSNSIPALRHFCYQPAYDVSTIDNQISTRKHRPARRLAAPSHRIQDLKSHINKNSACRIFPPLFAQHHHTQPERSPTG